jgi:hypothetical protein
LGNFVCLRQLLACFGSIEGCVDRLLIQSSGSKVQDYSIGMGSGDENEDRSISELADGDVWSFGWG